MISENELITEEEFDKWLADKSESIKKVASKVKPWHTYRHKTTGQRCVIVSYYENGTLKIELHDHDGGLFAVNRVLPLHVFGVNPDDLEIIEKH